MQAITRIAAPLALAIAFVSLAAGAADAKRDTRTVSGFTSLSLAAPIKVELVQGDTESLVLEGDERALEEIETVVEKGALKIRTKNRSWTSAPGLGKVRAYLTAKTIEGLAISGSGDIRTPSLKTAKLRISISGSGDVRIGSLEGADLDISVSGSGDVQIAAGKADTVTTSIAGSGDIKAGKLQARTAKVSIAGSGDAVVWAKESLNVSIVGSGDVRYYGDPKLQTSILGAGSVRRLGEIPS
jgi:putative autotransporter adhesin-like protein